MKLLKTRNDLKSKTKTTVAALLKARLADAIDLALMTKQAHWNLRGRQFIAVHEMLDGFRTEIDGHVDILAERIVQLGGVALGTTQAVAEGSKLKAYPADLISVDDHVAALAERYGILPMRLVRRSTHRAKPGMPTPPTSSPRSRGRSIRRCGSWKPMRRTMLERHSGKTLPGKFFEQRGTEVSGKVLIYGGGGGVGSAVARILAQSGYGLYLTGRGDQKVKQ